MKITILSEKVKSGNIVWARERSGGMFSHLLFPTAHRKRVTATLGIRKRGAANHNITPFLRVMPPNPALTCGAQPDAVPPAFQILSFLHL